MSGDEDAAKRVLDRILGTEFVIVNNEGEEISTRERVSENGVKFTVTQGTRAHAIKRIADGTIFPVTVRAGMQLNIGATLILNDISEFK